MCFACLSGVDVIWDLGLFYLFPFIEGFFLFSLSECFGSSNLHLPVTLSYSLCLFLVSSLFSHQSNTRLRCITGPFPAPEGVPHVFPAQVPMVSLEQRPQLMLMHHFFFVSLILVMAMDTKTAQTIAPQSLTARSWTQIKMVWVMSVMRMMITMAFLTSCPQALITVGWSPTQGRRMIMVMWGCRSHLVFQHWCLSQALYVQFGTVTMHAFVHPRGIPIHGSSLA